MADFDVEALLDSTAKSSNAKDASSRAEGEDRHRLERNDRRDRDRHREISRERDRKHRDRSRDRELFDRKATPDGALKNSDRAAARREPESNGDHYRGGGRARSRSPNDDRYYRPSSRNRRDDRRDDRRNFRPRDNFHGRGGRGGRDGRRRSLSPRKNDNKTPEPRLTEDERDRRTVFVQQLAARLRTKDLCQFFEKVGPVTDAQIVKDRVSGRSKGVGYVEFKDEESVQGAIQLTGQKLLGIPIIAQLTEAEKNRQARNPEGSGSGNSGVPFHRLYVGNIHFSITEQDLETVFLPFGALEFVQLQKDEQGRSRGYGFVQFTAPEAAKSALDKMNGFELAGRPIRVGLGNDKFTAESTANLLQRFSGQAQQFQGSSLYGSGGRGQPGGSFDRAGGRDHDKPPGGASALDDTDVAGVNFNNYSRDLLMRKLARTDDSSNDANGNSGASMSNKKQLPVNVGKASKTVVLKNVFDPAEEEARSGSDWVKEMEAEVKAECEDKYGRIVHISVDASTQGDVYLKFENVQGGENAMKGLNGRFFAGRMITVQPVVDAVYSSLFSRSRAL